MARAVNPGAEHDAHRAFRATRFFASLDGLRCISILAVIWHHTASRAFSAPIAHQGAHGVTLFFVISGFLITTLLLREKESTGDISLGNFYMRRALRIFPLYCLVLLVYLVLTALTEGRSPHAQEFYGNLKWYLTYTSNWFVDGRHDHVTFFFAWSLATEEQFYFLWPSVERRLRRWRPAHVALALVVVSEVARAGAIDGLIPVPLLVTILSKISSAICVGVLLAHVLHEPGTFSIAHRALGRKWSAAVALLLSVVALSHVEALGRVGDLLLVGSLGLLVGSCVIRQDNALAPVMTWRPAVAIGTVSYGIYLLHMLSANAARRISPALTASHPLFYFVLASLVAVVLATLSYRYYESIFLGMKHVFASGGARAPGKPVVPAPALDLAPAGRPGGWTLDGADRSVGVPS